MQREKSFLFMLGRRAVVFAFVLSGLISGFSFTCDVSRERPAITMGAAQTDITPAKPVLMSGYEVQVTRLMPGAEVPLTRKFLELVRSF